MSSTHYHNGVPKGIRTPVTAVKGQCPRPLDDGDTEIAWQIADWLFPCKGVTLLAKSSNHGVNHSVASSAFQRKGFLAH